MTKIELHEINIDGGTQPRCEIDEALVAEYAEDMRDGDQFRPVVLFNDGAKYWLADGFHRYFASKKVGFNEIHAEVKEGTKRDAILYSVSANGKHGKRRTNADKRNAVMKLLQDEEWSQWSDREIARQADVSHPFVAKIRESLTGNITSEKRKGADGRTINTSNIGTSNGNDLPDNVDPETGEVLNRDFEYDKEVLEKQELREPITPRMEEYNSSDQDVCPVCGQSWPEH